MLIRERSHRDDGAAFVEALGQLRQDLPTLLVWDNAPPHHPKKVQAVAAAAHITLTFLPFHAPELMPCEDLWRLTKFQIAANRASAAVHEQAERAVAWLATLSPSDRLLKSGLFGAKFQWLSTYPSKSAVAPFIKIMYFMPACSCSLLAPLWRVLVLLSEPICHSRHRSS